MAWRKKNSSVSVSPEPAFVKKNAVAEYHPTTDNFTYRQLRLASWYVKNKLLLQKIGLGALILWCVLTIGFGVFKWGEYFIFGYWEDKQLLERQVAEFQNYENLHTIYGAKPLVYDRPAVFARPGGKYDFVSQVKNSNERWLAMVRYRYVYDGGQTDDLVVTIIPGAEIPLAALGQTLPSFPTGLSLQIVDTIWQNLNAHDYPDVKKYINERQMFAVSPISFTRANRDDVPTASLKFELTNASAYSFWQADFYLLFFSGGQLEGMDRLTFEQFRTGEKRAVDLRFLDTSLNMEDVRVVPAINIFDPDIFMSPSD